MQIVSPISGKTVDSINIDEVMGMLAADLVTLIAGADISFRYPELERSYGEYGAMIKEGRVPPAEGRSVNAQTTQLCAPAYFELDSRVYDNWLESVYPSEVRRVDVTKIVTDQESYNELLRRTAERNIEGYRHEVNVAIDRALVDAAPDSTADPTALIGFDGGSEAFAGYLTEGTRYEVLLASGGVSESDPAPVPVSFRAVWSEILAVYFDMLCENNTYTEGNNVYGARRDDLVVYVPHKFLAYSDMSYIQRLFNERGLEKLPEIRTHNGAPVEVRAATDSPADLNAIFIMDKRVLNHVNRFMEAGSHDVDCRKSTVFDLHVEHMLKYAPFYKAFCILTPMPTAD